MKIDEVIQQPGQRERMLKEDILQSLHVAVPGELVSYNETKRTAVIQPTIRSWNSTEDPPLLLDVPVFFMGNFTFTPKKGDGCLVIFADCCVDAWLQGGGINSQSVYRCHSMSDGFAFVGFKQKDGEDISDALRNKKNLQMLVIDPIAEGESIEFIDSISQGTDGVIMPSKKTITVASQDKSGLVEAGMFYKDSNGLVIDGKRITFNQDGTVTWSAIAGG